MSYFSKIFRVCVLLFPLIALSTLGADAAIPADEGAIPDPWSEVSADGPWVVLLATTSAQEVAALSERIDVWGRDPKTTQLVALVDAEDYRVLRAIGYRPTLDEQRTQELSGLGEALQDQGGGIPGFPCYRTVEETFMTGQAMANSNPSLASWIDVGDSWEKTIDSNNGWDIFVLKLTQSAIPGPKPIFFANFGIHAREYATAELGTRLGEYLFTNYGTDPDVTWLLDHHEIHLMLQTNPDGRKQAETGILWRKNSNDNYCSGSNLRGADLNRNFEYEWNCCGGSSGQQCSEVFRGPTAASEPEIQTLQAYVRSIFPDQRGPGVNDPAPDDATGVAMDIHAFGDLVLWPWGFTTANAAQETAFATLGRKLAFFNGYFPLKITDFTVADGSSADFYYGDLGVAGLAYELGSSFFQSCSSFENDILQKNIDSFIYAAKVARTPYLTPAGPEAFDAETVPAMVMAGDLVTVNASADDTRYSSANGTEPAQNVASAAVYVDTPPWAPGATPIAMAAADGTFDSSAEALTATIETATLAPGRHMIFVQATDTDGNAGAVTAAFLEVEGATLIFSDDFEGGDLTAWGGSFP